MKMNRCFVCGEPYQRHSCFPMCVKCRDLMVKYNNDSRTKWIAKRRRYVFKG